MTRLWLAVSAALLIPLAAGARTHDWFGLSGTNGINGSPGRDGKNGDNPTVSTLGQWMKFDLRGENGGDGGAGGGGLPATHCEQPSGSDYPVLGADGGAGGDAGVPGRGGNGGDFTVYYSNIADLGLIFVDTSPGHAGEPGSPGKGGAGCRCEFPFHCHDGQSGRDGLSAQSDERDGKYGRVTVVDDSGDIPRAHNSASVHLNNIPEQVTLSKDIWETRSGAANLFADGSTVSDLYRTNVGRRDFPIAISWCASRPAKDFKDVDLLLLMQDDSMSATLPTNMWSKISIGGSEDLITVTVQKALYATEATMLSGQLRGSGHETVTELSDAAQVSDQVDTRIQIKVESKGLFYHTLYEGSMPGELMEVSPSGILLRIGRLPEIQDRDLRSGKKLRISMTVTRSLGDASAEQKIVLKQVVTGH